MTVSPGPITRFFTIAQVAARWGMNPGSVRKVHVNIGGLAGIAVGNQLIISLPALREYEERRLGPAARAQIKRWQRLLKRIENPPA